MYRLSKAPGPAHHVAGQAVDALHRAGRRQRDRPPGQGDPPPPHVLREGRVGPLSANGFTLREGRGG
jgi:hypothetical protein